MGHECGTLSAAATAPMSAGSLAGRAALRSYCKRMTSNPLNRILVAMVPSVSRSLAEQFNVFRVMHHGTHEKQLSNVFAWLLTADATHGLGDKFQQRFLDRVNRSLPEARRLPTSGYTVLQEVDTSGNDGLGRDIADIVLTSPQASLVIENFETSDGHGHDYNGYLAFGIGGGQKRCVVVLLCAMYEASRQTNGWQEATIVTYSDLLGELHGIITNDGTWQRTHEPQHFFIRQIIEHFVEGPKIMSDDERLAFIKAMCETGESARYGHRPHERAAEDFAQLMAQHAKRQFQEGRSTLAKAKQSLKLFAERHLVAQLNTALGGKHVTSVGANFVGQWEWCITLSRPQPAPALFLEFGPTAVIENAQAPEPLEQPDYAKVFVTRKAAANTKGIDHIIQSDVELADVLRGLSPDDGRLCDAVLRAILAN